MACSRGNFLLRHEYILAPRLGDKQQSVVGNFLRGGSGLRINTPLNVQFPPVVGEKVPCRIRASNVGKSNANTDELDWNFRSGRREIATVLTGATFCFLTDARAADVPGVMNKYIKRKKLDPLETYVPTILLAQSQFQEVDGRLDGEASKFADARSLLRNGPASSLRTDIRAVAQYAAEAGNDGGASSAVDQCLSALEDLDGLLLQASRSEKAPVEKMRQRLSTALTAIDRLLATVPAAILEKGKAVAKAYMESD